MHMRAAYPLLLLLPFLAFAAGAPDAANKPKPSPTPTQPPKPPPSAPCSKELLCCLEASSPSSLSAELLLELLHIDLTPSQKGEGVGLTCSTLQKRGLGNICSAKQLCCDKSFVWRGEASVISAVLSPSEKLHVSRKAAVALNLSSEVDYHVYHQTAALTLSASFYCGRNCAIISIVLRDKRDKRVGKWLGHERDTRASKADARALSSFRHHVGAFMRLDQLPPSARSISVACLACSILGSFLYAISYIRPTLAPTSSFLLFLSCLMAFPLRIFAAVSSNSSTSNTTINSTVTYTLKDNYVGSGFLTGFTFETISDPTHGRVNYVNQSYAVAQNLVSSTSSSFVMRADSTTKLNSSGPGRNSVRITSKNSYTQHLAIFDIRHMPQGCGTWPAAWETTESNWPASGEVDILEGVNDQGPNAMTLHTSSNCTMPSSRAMTGTSSSNDCYWADNGNAGCGVQNNKANSYGPAFNTAGGGWYVLERTTSFIRVFFWSRNDASVPSAVKVGSSSISTTSWGTPVALFPNTQCNLNTHFGSNNIIFDLTFCGDWAGAQSVYSASGCSGTCVDYVNNNPAAFQNAYWDVAAVRVYT